MLAEDRLQIAIVADASVIETNVTEISVNGSTHEAPMVKRAPT